MVIFIVIVGGFPSIYTKLEIRDGELYGNDELVCDALYVENIIITTTEKIKSL